MRRKAEIEFRARVKKDELSDNKVQIDIRYIQYNNDRKKKQR
jgi:hypothetical protein